MKKHNDPPTILSILSRFKLNEIFKLTGIFFGTNLFLGVFALIIIFFDTIFEFIGLNKIEGNFVNSFKETLNELSPHFWGGKFFLTAVIIYIVFMIIAKFDERKFKNWKFVFRIPVLSVPKLIGLSCLILFIGFFLGVLPVWISLWIIFFFVIFPMYLIGNITFRKVYCREFPEEYKIDFGETPPK
jgi:hypothetical protein